MATITIGGKDYVIPEMNFLAVERAWPYVQQATDAGFDPIKGSSAALSVFAAGLMEADDFNPVDYGLSADTKGDAATHQGVTRFLKKELKAKEMDKVRETMFEVLKEAGLEVTEGEAIAALAAALAPGTDQNLSQETVLDTSSSSSQQDAREAAGTP